MSCNTCAGGRPAQSTSDPSVRTLPYNRKGGCPNNGDEPMFLPKCFSVVFSVMANPMPTVCQPKCLGGISVRAEQFFEIHNEFLIKSLWRTTRCTERKTQIVLTKTSVAGVLTALSVTQIFCARRDKQLATFPQ